MTKSLFNLPKDITYLNNAYMAPQLRSVSKAGHEQILRKERPHSISPIDFFTGIDSLKSLFAKLINANEPQDIAIAPSASYALANAANSIPIDQGDEILLMGEQFPSNVYCWMEKAAKIGATVKFVEKPSSKEEYGGDWSQAVLAQINKKTKVVAMGQVHWADGYLFDLKSIRAALDVYGAYLVIDGTQSIGALEFSVKEIQPDVLVASAYKWLLGPYGVCLSYFGPRMHSGEPVEYSWMNRKDAEDFSNLVAYQDDYRQGANRYCMGQSSSFVYVGMLIEALNSILEWGTDSIQKNGFELQAIARNSIRSKLCTLPPEGSTGGHLWALRFTDNANLNEIAKRIKGENVYLSVRGSYARVSCHLYNDASDIERLADVLNAL